MQKVEDIEPFLQAGFVRKRYEDGLGEFLVTTTNLAQFPCLLLDWASSEAEEVDDMAKRPVVVELAPERDRIQVRLADGELSTKMLSLDSREGRRLLEGCGAVLAHFEGMGLPPGWDYTGDRKRIVLECSEGYTTVDFLCRGFASGHTTVDEKDCDPEKYKGVGWRRRLLEDGIENLKNSVEFFQAQRKRLTAVRP